LDIAMELDSPHLSLAPSWADEVVEHDPADPKASDQVVILLDEFHQEVMRKPLSETVDTIVIEPADQRFSLVVRAAFLPRPNLRAINHVAVGTPTPGCLLALAAGKIYRVPNGFGSAA
jgi:hypothetical protein